MALLAGGHFPCLKLITAAPPGHAGQPCQVTSIAMPPPAWCVGDLAGWVARHASTQLGMSRERVDRFHWELPLQAPGWSFLQEWPRHASDFLAGLAPRLHDKEIQAWNTWARGHGYDALAAVAGAAVAARGLDESLPASTPVARQRM